MIQPSLNDAFIEPIYPVCPYNPSPQFFKQNEVNCLLKFKQSINSKKYIFICSHSTSYKNQT